MRALEILFLLLFAFSVLQSLLGPIHPRLSKATVAATGIALIVLGAVFEGWRWQLLPAQVGFAALMLVWAPEQRRRNMTRVLAAAACACLLSLSVFLALQLPIPSLPAPEGPYGVGTFEYSISDPERAEGFSPDRNRELYVEVWYPADPGRLGDHPVQPLYHELYEGDPTLWSLALAGTVRAGTARPTDIDLPADDTGSDLRERAVEYWVEDIRFIADTLLQLKAPIEGFVEALDVDRLGVFGMSMGGAAAGEFCKLDRRCAAGANIDGRQGGRHWNVKVDAPFLMIYDEAHRAGNDFAYLPPADDFWDLTVAGTTHLDFVELSYVMPLLKTLGFAGPIGADRTVDILNQAHLDFFDRDLKGDVISRDALTAFPEITFREHEIVRRAQHEGRFRSLARRVLGYWRQAKSDLKHASAQALRDIGRAACREIRSRLSRTLPVNGIRLDSLLPNCAASDRPVALAAAAPAGPQ